MSGSFIMGMGKLGSYARQNRVAKVLREMGRYVLVNQNGPSEAKGVFELTN